jgi:tetratricopeptide (TPR) repeat protein
VFNVSEAKTVKSTQRHSALAAGIIALSALGAPLMAQQPRSAPPAQRGGNPNPDTPQILVTTFQSSDRKLGVQAGDELRKRLQSEHSAKELFVIQTNQVNGTLEASGYRPDSALNASDLMELARNLRGEYVIDGKATRVAGGNTVKLETRILKRAGPQIIAQPLPVADGRDVGDAAKLVEKSISDALKQIPAYNECFNSLRAAKYDEAAAKARAGIAIYPNAAWSRVCLLNAYSLNRATPPDSVIAISNQILAIDPTSLLALTNLADAYKAKGDRDKAIEMNLRIYRLDPSNQSIAQSIVQELAQSGAPDKALPIIDSLLAGNPADPGMIKSKWLLQLRIGKFKDALVTGEELVKVDTASANVDYYNRQIGAAQSDSNNPKITEFAAKAGQKFPREISFPLLLAQTYRRMGQLQEAMQAAMRATVVDPKDTRGWQLAIVIANDLNQPETAMSLAQRAISAGADRSQIAPTMLAPVSAAVKKAQTSQKRADWQEALKTAEVVDGVAPSQETKFFIGVASFQVAADILNEVQPLVKSTRAADKTAACNGVKEAEGYLAKTSVAMPAGGRVDAGVAAQILGNVTNYNDFIAQVKKAFCK